MLRMFDVLNLMSDWKKGDLPMDPVIQIIANGIQKRKDGSVLITQSLVCDSEIDYVIDELHKELELIRSEAKRTIKKQKQKMLNAKNRNI